MNRRARREIANIPIARNKPVLGSGNFIRESGIGIQYVMNDPLVMFGTHPSLTGKAGEVVLGKKSGKASIVYKLGELGLGEASDDELAQMLVQVKQAGIVSNKRLSSVLQLVKKQQQLKSVERCKAAPQRQGQKRICKAKFRKINPVGQVTTEQSAIQQ